MMKSEGRTQNNGSEHDIIGELEVWNRMTARLPSCAVMFKAQALQLIAAAYTSLPSL